MKMFNHARLKLMATYTGILMLLSISFSIVIGVTATQEINRPVDRPPNMISWTNGDTDFDDIFQQRAENAKLRIAITLVFVNIAVLVLGSVGSYFLAQWMLRPIEKAMNDQARFIGDASHELRTPLAAIAMENEVILRDKKVDEKELRNQIQSNLDEIGKLQGLTNYLLELDNGEDIELTQVDLSSVVKEAIAANKKLIAAKHTVIDNKVNSMVIATNPNALSEILSIIINNAIKYSPEKSKVSIVVNDNEVSIIDEGMGIAESDLPHIFDRFYRAEKSRTSGGYGLGLSLAKHLADKIGAKIAAYNNTGKGSTFAITLSVKHQTIQSE